MQNTLETLKKARLHKKQWVNNALALIEGIPVDKEKIPISYHNCCFGQWYYNEGQCLSEFPEFKDIEDPHMQLHVLYMKIFNLLFKEQPKHSLFDKLIGKAAKADEMKKAKAKELHKRLKKIASDITEKLDKLEAKLKKTYKSTDLLGQ